MINRTLLVTQSFDHARGGGIERLLRTFAASVDPENTVVVTPPASDQDSDGRLPYAVIRKNLLAASFVRPSWLMHLPWFLSTIRSHSITRIVFGHYAGWVSLGVLAKLITGTPYIIEFNGLDFLSYRRTAFRRMLLRINLAHAEYVVAISAYTRGLLKNFGVPEGKLVTINPAVEAPTIPPADAVAAFATTHACTPHTLITVGRLVKRKGIDRVIRALPAVRETLPDVTYLIAGDGPERVSLEHLARDLGVSSAVRFLGRVTDEERDCAYASAQAFIMLPTASTGDVEGFGIVYVEALLRGIPIIATNSAGVTDIISDQNGIGLDENADAPAIATAITSLLSTPTRAHTLGQHGKAEAEQKFSVAQFVNKYRTILSRPDAPARDIRVSIVIPAWNSTETLPRTLHAISLQTWKNLEVIVVDDGSSDNPKAVCDRFPWVRCVAMETNSGAPAARNRGFRESTGEYVFFCDADVTMHPRCIERMVTTLELNPHASYAYCSFRFSWRTFDLFDFDPQRLKESNYICTMSLIRRSAFPGWDESIKRLQDWDLWLTMLEQGKTGVWVPARLFSATVGRNGISARVQRPPQAAVNRIRTKHRLG